MYLHIGNEMSIALKEIIAIIDLDAIDFSLNTQELLDIARIKEKLVVSGSDSKPKSCIITDSKYYLSAISATTLARRAHKWE